MTAPAPDAPAARAPRLAWQRLDHPLVWRACLPLFFLPWLIEQPGEARMLWAGAGLLLFLILYVAGIRAQGRRLVALATAILLSFAMASTGSNWTVLSISAAAMAGQLRPARRAAFLLALFAAATALALATGQPPFLWLLGVFLMVMVGLATISRSLLEDRNRALAAAQGEVRLIAAAAERERISRDLHDLRGRTLTLIAIKSDLAARLMARDPARAAQEIRKAAAAARDGLARTDEGLELRVTDDGHSAGVRPGSAIAGLMARLDAGGGRLEVEGDASGTRLTAHLPAGALA